jgi:hypothetical protein
MYIYVYLFVCMCVNIYICMNWNIYIYEMFIYEYIYIGDTIVGAFCDISSLLYYSAPLAKMADIIKKKDSLGKNLNYLA